MPPRSPEATTPASELALCYVDDSATAREGLRRALAARGHALEAYATLGELYDRLARAPRPRAVLFDLELGADERGSDGARWVRERFGAAVAVAFFTSAQGAEEDPALRALGPVFRKEQGPVEALRWLLAQRG